MRGKNQCDAVNAKNALGKEFAKEEGKMCQRETIQVLKRKKKWMTAREINKEKPDVSFASISHNLSKLRRSNQIRTRMATMITKDGRKLQVMEYHK